MLVMTSANPGGEPLVIGNDEAVRRLAGIADACARPRPRDHRALRRQPGARRARRARLRAPRARLHAARHPPAARRRRPCSRAARLLKNTVCLTRGREAFLSPHIGDLDNGADLRGARRGGGAPHRHPRGRARGLRPRPASGLLLQPLRRGLRRRARPAGHRRPAPPRAHRGGRARSTAARDRSLGLSLDGVGLGTDGTAWGGELLRVDGARFRGSATWARCALPGGDRAAREPWRMAAAVLHALGRGDEIATRFERRRGARRARRCSSAGPTAP